MKNANLTISSAAERRKRASYGIALLVVGLFIYLVFGLNTQAGSLTTFGLNLPGTEAISIPDLVVPALPIVYAMSAIAAFTGAFQLARGVRSTGWLVGILALTFLFSFLLWATQDLSLIHI